MIQLRWDEPAPKLQGDSLTRLQREWKDTHLLVIDEKSMVGAITLYQIDQRLREAKPENADLAFGGISVVLMGDFNQLPPVKYKAMFEVISTRAKIDSDQHKTFFL